jgi:hypothetical protein
VGFRVSGVRAALEWVNPGEKMLTLAMGRVLISYLDSIAG